MHNQTVLEVLKLTLKFTIKCSYMFRFNIPSSGSLLLYFAKVKIIKIFVFVFYVALRPNAGHGHLILEVSRSHTTTHHSR